jgi:hypothetical protein
MRTRSKKYTSSQTPFEILDPALFMAILSFLNKTEWMKDYSRLYRVSHACRGNILQTKLMMQDIICGNHQDLAPIIFFLKQCAAPRLLIVELFNTDDRAVGREGLFVDGLLMQLAVGCSPLLHTFHLGGVSIGKEGAVAFAQAVAAGLLVN